MADERWKSENANLQAGEGKRKSENAEMQVGQVEGGEEDYKDAGYGGFAEGYKPIPPGKVMVRPQLGLKMGENYPLDWTAKDWQKIELHYMAQIERIMESWLDDTYVGWALWMELTKLIILLLDEIGLKSLASSFYTTLFQEGGPRIESFRFNLFMPKFEQEEYERYQDRKGKPYDRTVDRWSPEEEEEEKPGEEGGPESGRHFWSPRPEAVDETG